MPRLSMLLWITLAAAPASAQLNPPGPGWSGPSEPGPAPVIAAELIMRRGIARSSTPPPAPLAAEDRAAAAMWIGTRRGLTEADAAALEDLGLILDRTATGGLPGGTVQRATVPWAALDALAAHPLVERIEPARPAIALRPLDTIGVDQGTLRTHLRPEDGLTGDGVVVAAIDSPIDVAHPHFFHADAGVYPWVDRDGSGDYSAGDAVALDGAVAPLVVFDAGFFDPLTDPGDWQNLDDRLDPGLDWLFADLDGDGQRGVGAAQGFSDDDPALGEPLFVAHDADGDGQFGLDERLFRLGTSKVRQVSIGGRTWRNGRDLAEAVDAARVADATHATGVASILLGGQPGFHRRIGLAPGASYVGYADTDPGVMTFADAAENGASIFLHEWSQPAGLPGDGGSLFERAMDEARADGMLQVCPLGNLNGADKQVERVVDGPSVRLDFDVGDGFFDGQGTRPYSAVVMHVAWIGDAEPQAMRWIRPDGAVDVIEPGPQPRPLGALAYSAGLDRSARGTRWLLVYLWHPGGPGNSLDVGRWGLELDGLPPGTVVHGRITDDMSGWSAGIAWVNPTDDHSSLTYPSTADSAIGVAAFGGRIAADGQFGGRVGELRAYSGRGPRIDGAQAVDIAAPDDPLAALASSALPELPRGHSALFAPFGGTSGAGPHVAAALALLFEQHPEWSPDTIEFHLLATGDRADLVPDAGPVPNEAWGQGKLQTHFMLYGASPPIENQPPSADGLAFDGEAITVEAPADPEGDPLRFRLDLDYDGVWDGPWQAVPRLVMPADRYAPGQRFAARVAQRDTRGGAIEQIGYFVMPGPGPDAELIPDMGSADAGLDDRGVIIVGDPDHGIVIVGDPDAEVVIIGADGGSDESDRRSARRGCAVAPGNHGSSSGGPLGGFAAALLGLWIRRRR